MSRSYKKFPPSRMTLLDRESMKWGKSYANRKIRKKLKDPEFEMVDGRYYKHFGLDTWELYEFRFHETLNDVIRTAARKNKNLEEAVQEWKKILYKKITKISLHYK